MVWHRGNNNSARLNVNVITTPEWSAARKLNIQQLMPRASLPTPFLRAFGHRLKLVRLAKGYGEGQQGKFAELAGFPSNTYNQWEKGANVPTVYNLFLLCSRHKLSIDWILLGSIDGMPEKIAKRVTELLATDPVPEDVPPMRDPARVIEPKRRRRVA
jgi:transcriptional regulator with XRE-family HTH domain